MMRVLAIVIAVACAQSAYAQAQQVAKTVTIAAGTPVQLATRTELSRKGSAKGDPVDLYLPDDLMIGNTVAIRAGARATGEISDSRVTGGLGTNGRLSVAPLYLRIGDIVIRLQGIATAVKGLTKADTIVGLAVVTPVISGRTAVIKAGTRIQAVTVRAVTVPIVTP